MSFVFRVLCMIFSIMWLASCATYGTAFEQRLSDFNDEYQRLQASLTENPYSEVSIGLLRAQFTAHLAEFAEDEAIKTLSDAELLLLFGAGYNVLFYSGAVQDVDRLEGVAAEIERRGVATDHVYVQLQQAWLVTRRWELAATLASNHPTRRLEIVPTSREERPTFEGSRSHWRLTAKPLRLLRQAFAFDRGGQVVVVSSPFCHFSRDATAAIEADPELFELFGRHSIWLRPADMTLDAEAMLEWNQQHAQLPIVLVHHQGEWPEIESWATPTFYFYRDGSLVETVNGWPAGGAREALLSAAKRVGLLP